MSYRNYNSNTTFVKVKYASITLMTSYTIIQIQHLLKLNKYIPCSKPQSYGYSNTTFVKVKSSCFLHLKKLKLYSNTTFVKVKYSI